MTSVIPLHRAVAQNAVMIEFSAQTVGQLASEVPTSIRVFEMWKIDYCCGGQTPLPEACATAGKSVDEFIAELERATAIPDGAARDWSGDTLAAMSAKIVAMYHVYTREELQTIAPIADKVLGVHGDRRPELAEVVSIVRELTNDLLPHMLKEEQVLFPYVAQLDEAVTGHQPAPTPFFGTARARSRRRVARAPARRDERICAAGERVLQLPRTVSALRRARAAHARAHPH
jgi:regulator of cell morphogenesis and NO signaling